MEARRPPLSERIRARVAIVRCWLFLRRRVTGRLKLRGRVGGLSVHPSFRCDGDLWLGIHSEQGEIVVGAGVSASGPLIVTAVRRLQIEPGVLFGPNVLITDHYHGNPRDPADRATPPSRRPLHSPGPIEIGTDVQVGANAVILSPATIGARAIIGANAVVKGDVPPDSVYTGLTPAGLRTEQKQ